MKNHLMIKFLIRKNLGDYEGLPLQLRNKEKSVDIFGYCNITLGLLLLQQNLSIW